MFPYNPTPRLTADLPAILLLLLLLPLYYPIFPNMISYIPLYIPLYSLIYSPIIQPHDSQQTFLQSSSYCFPYIPLVPLYSTVYFHILPHKFPFSICSPLYMLIIQPHDSQQTFLQPFSSPSLPYVPFVSPS